MHALKHPCAAIIIQNTKRGDSLKSHIKKLITLAKAIPADIRQALSSFAISALLLGTLLGSLGIFVAPKNEAPTKAAPCGFEPYIIQNQRASAASAMLECSVSEENDLLLLARCAEMTFGNESYTARVALCAVILNRAESDRFPKSIAAVIRSAGLYPESFEGTVSERTMHAARTAMLGVDPTMGSLYIIRTDDALFDQYEGSVNAIYGQYAFLN